MKNEAIVDQRRLLKRMAGAMFAFLLCGAPAVAQGNRLTVLRQFIHQEANRFLGKMLFFDPVRRREFCLSSVVLRR